MQTPSKTNSSLGLTFLICKMGVMPGHEEDADKLLTVGAWPLSKLPRNSSSFVTSFTATSDLACGSPPVFKGFTPGRSHSLVNEDRMF